MAYEGKSINEIIQLIGDNRMFLPSIQRKYVWSENQITKLFDSIMLGYPIGTFLFWEVNTKDANEMNYSFYKFINEYHERDNYNNQLLPSPININADSFFSVLDGQQRLTSMFIALQGSLSLKKYKAWASKDEAYIKKELYLNIEKDKQENEEDEDENTSSLSYDFKFLSNAEAKECTDYFKVKNILPYKETETFISFLRKYPFSEIAQKNLTRLWTVLNAKDNKSPINYFKVPNGTDMNTVLKIFVRVNSGGTILSKTDLLFSTIVSYWDDGRTKIEDLITNINKIGEKFKFTNDFIMRTCLCLLDFPVNLKPETFTKNNVMKIKENWDKIEKSIDDAIHMISKFGFCDDNLVSYNAIIPIVFYYYKDGKINELVNKELRKYLIIAETKQLFGTASNQVITVTRKALNDHNLTKEEFSLSWFYDLSLTGDANFHINDYYLESLFRFDKGSYTFMILSLLYPNIKVNGTFAFHQDHMHPETSFKYSNLKSLGLDNKTIDEWRKNYNKLANLQLLQSDENESKNRDPLNKWLLSHKDEVKYLPPDISYELKNFAQFYSKRKEILKNALKKLLGIYENYFTFNIVKYGKEKYVEIVEVRDKKLYSYRKIENNFETIKEIVKDEPIILQDKDKLKLLKLDLSNDIYDLNNLKISELIYENEKVKELQEKLTYNVNSFKTQNNITTESIGLEYKLFEISEFCVNNGIK